MKMSSMYIPTLKETPSEAEVPSHQLMLRAGLIRKLSAGIYSFLPLGLRVVRKIEDIVREEMDKCSQEVMLPVMQTADIWKQSGRWEEFGPLMVKFKDRKDREYCLGPTHEEVVTELVRDEVRSYKDLPFNIYQIQTKVRDEIRPRFGVMRGREFLMKDAYSFDRDYQGLDESYQVMYDTYNRIFDNCGLKTTVVEADTGTMGGKDSHEFMVLADSGEDRIALCQQCDYAANVERAESPPQVQQQAGENEESPETVSTPGITTIDDLVDFLDIGPEQMIKVVAVVADGEPVMALVRGDDQLNEVKLANHLGAMEVRPAEGDEFSSLFNSVAGFAGPVGLERVKILADHRIQTIASGVTGANQQDKHLIHVTPGRDFQVDRYLDLRQVQTGDPCPRCGGQLEIQAGIEVGHIFKLGTKYSESMGATYLDQDGQEQPIIMGSYGIGITRLVAAAIEQNHDDRGIIWPGELAPFQVIILPLGKSEEVHTRAGELYQQLKATGIEALLDDRQERAGVKFNDAELMGIPIRVTIGSRSLEKGVVEVQIRRTGEESEYPVEEAGTRIRQLLNQII